MASTSDELLTGAGVPSSEAQSPPSDNDSGERPVRKQLKETSIESAPGDHNPDMPTENGNSRKRSFEESRDDAPDPNENSDGSRKRSRESSPEDTMIPGSATNNETSTSAVSEKVSDVECPKKSAAPIPLDTLIATDHLYGSNIPPPKNFPKPGTPWSEPDAEDSSDLLFVHWDYSKEPGLDPVPESPTNSNQDPDGPVETITISDDESVSPAGQAEAIVISDDDSVRSKQSEEPEQHSEPEPNPESPVHVNSYIYVSSDEEYEGYFLCQNAMHYVQERNLPGWDVGHSSEDSDAETTASNNSLASWVLVSGDEEFVTATESTTLPGDTHNTHSQDPKDLNTESKKNDDTNKQMQDTAQPTTEGASGTTESDASKALTKKRSREQLDENTKKPEASQAPSQAVGPDGKTMEGEPEKKRHRDNSQERDTKTADAFAASAFTNTSASSPFASLGKPLAGKDTNASTSAFAASSMAAFAGSEKSPFGTLGATTNSSVFKPTPSGTSSFGSTAGSSGFGALGSGFSGVGGGFASTAKSGGLTSFAAPNVPTTFQSKPIGAEESEAEESNNGDEENATFEAEKTDDRFFEQTIETGEEEEETVFSCKAKLFHFNKEWKERGLGTFKVNVRKNADGKQTGRMIMRADGAGRVMLNSIIFKGMNYGDAKNQPPKSKQILLASTEEGHTVPLLLRTGNEAYATELYEVIGDLLEQE